MSIQPISRIAPLALLCCLTWPAQADDAAFARASRIGLVVPEGLSPSTRFPGFENKTADASILVVEVPTAAFPEIEKQVTSQALKQQGMTEDKRETLSLKGGKGVLITGRQAAEGKKVRKWVFLVSLNDAAAMISVQQPDAPKPAYSDAAIRTTLLSVTTRPTVPIEEQLSLVPLSFGDLAGLRPIRTAGISGVILTEGPKDTTDAAEQPILVVSIGLNPPAETEARTNFARNLFTGFSDFKDLKVLSGEMLRLSNQPTHELQAEATDVKTGAPMRLVQWVRFGSGAFLRFVGLARAEAWQDSFPRFRTVRDTVAPRSPTGAAP